MAKLKVTFGLCLFLFVFMSFAPVQTWGKTNQEPGTDQNNPQAPDGNISDASYDELIQSIEKTTNQSSDELKKQQQEDAKAFSFLEGKGRAYFFIYLLGCAFSVSFLHLWFRVKAWPPEFLILNSFFWFVSLPILFLFGMKAFFSKKITSPSSSSP